MIANRPHPKDPDIKLMWDRGDSRKEISNSTGIAYRQLCQRLVDLLKNGEIKQWPPEERTKRKNPTRTKVQFGEALKAQRLGIDLPGSKWL